MSLFTIRRMLRTATAALGLSGLFGNVPAFALDIAFSPTFEAPVVGQCIGADSSPGAVGGVGLGCYYSKGQDLTDPASFGVDTIRVRQPIDSPAWLRAALYEATGSDPGLLMLVSKLDGSDGGLNGHNDFLLYDDEGNGGNALFGNLARGMWEYTGSQVLGFFVVKARRTAVVWDVADVTRSGTNDGNADTALQGQFDLSAWYELLGEDAKNPAMSHVSLYARTTLTPPPPGNPQAVPAPPTAWLLGLLVSLLIAGRGVRRARHRH